MKIRFYNGLILTMADGDEIKEGEVWTEDNRIKYVGDSCENFQEEFDKEINLEGNLLMPGFKNAHTHSAMTFGRSYSDILSCGEWLTKIIFPMEAKMTGEHIYTLSKIAFLEYLSNGITACFDMYYEPEYMARASIEYGFRTVMCGAMNDFKESIESLESYFLKFNSINELISYKIGIHAEYTTSLELQKKVSDLIHKYKTPFYCHNSETESEVKDCIDRYSMTPTELFESIGLFDYGGGGFHCTYLNENDINIFQKRQLSAITNPASNLKLASGIAPIYRLNNKNINIGIGTDGAASNNSLNMFKEMYLTSTLQKYLIKDASVCPAKDVLYMATVGSAKSMGLNDSDILAEGKLADMIILDLKQPNMQPLNDIYSNIVYSGSNSNVKMTMVNGVIRYMDGKFYIDDNIDDVYKRTQKIVLELK